MSDRIVMPINQAAFNLAQAEFKLKHPGGIGLPGSKTYTSRRKRWLHFYRKYGGLVDHGTTFQAALPNTAVESCPYKNVIESVEFVGGTPAAVLAADAIQRVNLPRDAKFLDGVRVLNLDRLGRVLRVRVKFRRAKKERFKVALLAHNNNVTYAGPEQAARPAYQCVRTAAAGEHTQGAFDHYQGAAPHQTSRTGSSGEALVDFEIPASGGDEYKLVAWDVNGNVVFSQFKITTLRTLFYATFLGDDPNGVRVNQAWFRAQLQNTYTANHIELVWIGQENLIGVVYHDTIMSLTVGGAIRAAAQTKNCALGRPYEDYAPYVLKFGFVDHCADALIKDIQPLRQDDVSPGDTIDVPLYTHTALQRQADPVFDWRKRLWLGLGETLDQFNRTTTGHEWFESATLTLHEVTGDRDVACVLGDLTPLAAVGAAAAMVAIQVTVPAGVPAHTDVTVKLRVVITNRSVLGQSLTGRYAGITLQPARSMFVAVHQNQQLSSAIHECGHAIGMVATTAHQGLTHATVYDHQGSHCWHAVAGPVVTPDLYHALPLKDTGDCLMYGLIPAAGPNMAFCANCAGVLRKLDLSDGFTG